MTTIRPSMLDLHPVEALLALLFLSAAALLRLVTDPPRPLRRPVPYSSAAIALAEIWDQKPPPLSSLISPEEARRIFAVICPSVETAQEWADNHIS